ncbi:Na(+)-translocating NADH-quinone reductase subunit A [Rhodobacterales bacterium HKCCE2091]|nr:Na(+)-translocating NADH-quinone reductase subunit A [Rhodobacterales bacterium HKCCE2091]
MLGLATRAGLSPRFPSPPEPGGEAAETITEEAAVTPPPGPSLRVDVLAEEGAAVAAGAPVARLRDAPEVVFTASMPAIVGNVRLGRGRRLTEIVLFRETAGDRFEQPEALRSAADPRPLMLAAGAWPLLRRRPFGGMPDPGEGPAAIVVMAADTRPFAPDPRQAIEGREEAFARGLHALSALTEGPVFVCTSPGKPLVEKGNGAVRQITGGPRHPQGLAGIRIHDLCPARIDAPVWDIHAEDVAAIGHLVETGMMPATRLVRLAGAALREGRLVRTQPGADLRGLSHGATRPGGHVLLSGSPLDGHPAHWLGARDRQVTVLPREEKPGPRHWFVEALTGTARAAPAIPTEALRQAFGGGMPGVALIRALSAGDDETAIRLGVLSLLEEDVALADYALGGAHLPELLRRVLSRIEAEMAP